MPNRISPSLSLADEAYGVLHRRITRCDLAPGTPLTAGRLATALGMGITPVREALTQLQRDGLVVTLPRRGYLVAPMTAELARQSFEAWELVRPGIMALAVGRIDDAGIEDVVGLFEESMLAGRAGDGRTSLERFSLGSLRLAAATGNELVVDLARSLEGHLLRMFVSVVGPDFTNPSQPDWETLLRSRDPDLVARTMAGRAAQVRTAVEPLLSRLGTVAGPTEGRTAAPGGVPAVPAPRAPVVPGSMADDAYLLLRDRIVRGDLAPGSRCTVRGLAAALGLGITPVREALARLDGEHLVDTLPRLGYRVTPVGPRDARQAVELWALLVPAITDLAVRNASPEQARAVADLMDHTGADRYAVARNRAEGWRRLAAAGGNRVLADAYCSVEGLLSRAYALLVPRGDATAPPDLDWVALVAARDVPAAQEQLARYVTRARAWVDALASGPAPG